jgi:hypothetical protein
MHARMRTMRPAESQMRDSNLQPSGYEHAAFADSINKYRHFRACLLIDVRVWLRRFIGLSIGWAAGVADEHGLDETAYPWRNIRRLSLRSFAMNGSFAEQPPATRDCSTAVIPTKSSLAKAGKRYARMPLTSSTTTHPAENCGSSRARNFASLRSISILIASNYGLPDLKNWLAKASGFYGELRRTSVSHHPLTKKFAKSSATQESLDSQLQGHILQNRELLNG